MSLIKFKEFISMKESSPYTRSRDAYDQGTGVPIFRFSRSTPRAKPKRKKKK